MARYRSRRPHGQYLAAAQELSTIRTHQEYQAGDPEMIEQAAQAAFAGEVALNRLSGAQRVPRAMRWQLHHAAVQIEESREFEASHA